MRQLLGKKRKRKREERDEEDFNQKEEILKKLPCLEKFARDRDNIVTNDASRT